MLFLKRIEKRYFVFRRSTPFEAAFIKVHNNNFNISVIAGVKVDVCPNWESKKWPQ
jgi:hypothetical protein